MKTILTIIAAFICANTLSQYRDNFPNDIFVDGKKASPVYVEITDTVETVYDTRETGIWTRSKLSPWSMIPETRKDSVGVDTLRIRKFFYLEFTSKEQPKDSTILYFQTYEYKKVYLDYMEIKRLNKMARTYTGNDLINYRQ